ncbi:MAG: hypothetical protein AAF494_00805 [Pseudomonadota bacterium]
MNLDQVRRSREQQRHQANKRFAHRHPAVAADERALRKTQAGLHDRYGHRRGGTPETLEKASRVQQGSLARLFMGGHISVDQLAWSAEIRAIAERIGRDVGIGTVSLETRVDCGNSGRARLVESLGRVRAEVAYTHWRAQLEQPRPVLALIVDDVSVRAVGRTYRMRDESARGLLREALDAWPDHCTDARDRITQDDLTEMEAVLA